MSDEALRELERAWRTSGDPSDEARLVAEALRLGRLVRERVELAAYLRHGAARVALGDGAPAGEHVPWSAWVAAVDDDGRRALVRALVAGVRAWRELADPGLIAACEVLEGWLQAPGTEHARLLREARDALRVDPIGPEALDPDALARTLAAWCLREACLLVLAPGPDAVEGALRRVASVVHADALPWVGERRGPILDPLLAWALGPGHAWRAAPAPRDVSGDEESAARYLRERLRRGEVPAQQVRLLAYAGDASAAAACDGPAPTSPDRLEAWVAGLQVFDPTLERRVVAALAGHVLLRAITRTWLGAPVTPRGYTVRAGFVRQARDACDALRGWAERPTDDARAALTRHAQGLAPGPMDRAAPGPRAERQLVALRAALACARGEGAPRAALSELVAAIDEGTDDLGLLARGLVAGWARVL